MLKKKKPADTSPFIALINKRFKTIKRIESNTENRKKQKENNHTNHNNENIEKVNIYTYHFEHERSKKPVTFSNYWIV